MVGAAINYVNYGTLTGYDATGLQLGNYSANQYGFDVGWGRQIFGDLSGGATLKGSLQTIGSATYENLAVDVGTLWQPCRHFKLGLAVTNLGTTVAGYAQDTALRLGGSYRIDFDDSNELLFAASGAWEPLGVSSLQLGAEDKIYRILSLRVGYQAQLANTQIQGMSGWTAGLGVLVEGFNVDYAYLPFGDLGAANWITLGYKFN